MASNLTSLCGPCCSDSCRPRLSVGVVYPNGMLELAKQSTFPNLLGATNLCGSGCGGCGCDCRPRLSVGVVYPNDMIQLAEGKDLLTSLCGPGGCCGTDCCRPRLSVGVVYDGTQNL